MQDNLYMYSIYNDEYQPLCITTSITSPLTRERIFGTIYILFFPCPVIGDAIQIHTASNA